MNGAGKKISIKRFLTKGKSPAPEAMISLLLKKSMSALPTLITNQLLSFLFLFFPQESLLLHIRSIYIPNLYCSIYAPYIDIFGIFIAPYIDIFGILIAPLRVYWDIEKRINFEEIFKNKKGKEIKK